MPKPIRTPKVRKNPFWTKMPFKIGLVVFVIGLSLAATGFAYAANREADDSFCASCHTQPESTFYDRELAGSAVDLASAHKSEHTRCIDCHSGVGVLGRLSAELLGAHNALAWYTGTAVQPAKLTQAVQDGSCLKCHTGIAARQDMNNHFHVFLAQWQQMDKNAGTCVSCHNGHLIATSQTVFMDVNTVRNECEACHAVAGEGRE